MGWCRVVKGPVVKQLQLRGSGFGTLQHLGPDDSAVVRQPLWHCAVAPSQSLCRNASVPPTGCLPLCLLLPRAHLPRRCCGLQCAGSPQTFKQPNTNQQCS